ncbi:MAG: hypothetical protein DRI61_16615 [Chloroflexi bacterium]|nr:MAG: hypothetical protein DRI61_16615 [Chloroflexota bacterium]
MSKEEWSLKGKGIIVKCGENLGYVVISEETLSQKERENADIFYPKHTVEFLRKKLIEDVKRTVPSDEELLIAVLVKRINKRFGVENE